MREYHKIQTLFKRDMTKPNNPLIFGEWTCDEFQYLRHNEWDFTEKVDGTNIRIMWDGDNVRFGGKTDRAQLPAPLVARLQELFPDDSGFRSVFEASDGGVCLYGEGYGHGIQKAGRLYCAHQDFILFDVRVGEWWLKRSDVRDIGTKLGLDVVPGVGSGTLDDCIATVERGFTSTFGNFEAEGIVARPSVELKARNGERIIAKIKHRDFATQNA